MTQEEKKTFDQLDKEIQTLAVQKSLEIEKALFSDNPSEVLAAQTYLQRKNKENKPNMKSSFFLPDDFTYTGNGYKAPIKSISFDVMRQMGKTWIVSLIKQSRVDQVSNFLEFSLDEQKEGFTIRKKRGLFDTKVTEMSSSDKKKAEEIVKFLENSGINEKWESLDTFDGFIKKILNDSMTYDQLTFECLRNKKGELVKYRAVDASLIRLLDSIDPKHKADFEHLKVDGFAPRFGMVWNGEILKNRETGIPVIYYPWELGYGIRNNTTSVYDNGYGISELEVAVELITWILWGFQYNGNFFKQGSQPKGFINIKNGNSDNTIINELRQSWRQMMSGVDNSHKIPIFEGIDLQWNDLQMSNRDMEFNNWVEMLIVVLCSVYRIDPTELGFEFNMASKMFGQDGQKQRLDHSKKKGLVPLLKFLQRIINKYIVSELDDSFEFVFTGINIEDEASQVELDVKKVSGGLISFESAFEKYMGRKYDKKKDTILNQQFLQFMQMNQMGGDEMNSEVDAQAAEQGQESYNPFEDFNKSSNPFLVGLNKYIEEKLS